MPDNFITIIDLIIAARSRGVDLGRGDPREHLSYLSKIGLLPPAKKKSNLFKKIVGHYPASTLDTLHQISEMKKQGMTYSHMKFVLANSLPTTDDYRLQTNGSSDFYSTSLPAGQAGQPLYLSLLIIGILLGYLLATKNVNPSLNSKENTSPVVAIVNPASNSNTATLLRTVSASESPIDSNSDSIYLISVPKSHFGNLDKKISL